MFPKRGMIVNPFETMFGREPKEFIQREDETNLIGKSVAKKVSFLVDKIENCTKYRDNSVC